MNSTGNLLVIAEKWINQLYSPYTNVGPTDHLNERTGFEIFGKNKNMQYFYAKKPFEYNGDLFIVLTWLELDILYFKDGFLLKFSINFKSGPFIKVFYVYKYMWEKKLNL